MSSKQISTITTHYSEPGYNRPALDVRRDYAVTKDIKRELYLYQLDKGQLAGKDLDIWMQNNGGQLLKEELVYGDGVREERYYRNGKLHRDNGPAEIRRYSDDTTFEYYYRDGTECTKDEYYPKQQSAAPGATVRGSVLNSDGWPVNYYYRDGIPCTKDEYYAKKQPAIPGVTIQRPAAPLDVVKRLPARAPGSA
jgi:hypothetical protein